MTSGTQSAGGHPSRAIATIELVDADYSSTTLLLDEMLADLIASGETMVTALEALGLAARTIYKRLARDEQFARLMDAAREIGADVIANRARQIIRGDKAAGGTGDWKRDRSVAEFDLKLLSKWHPKSYGDKLQVESKSSTATVTISDDPIEAARQYADWVQR